MIDTVLFDLDGTLLPMDQEVFAKAYIGGLAGVSAAHGYDPSAMAKAILAGTVAMAKNGGGATNEEVFWQKMSELLGERIFGDVHIFDEFYRTDFQKIQSLCGYTPLAAKTVEAIRTKGFRVALATNPLFPKVATDSRIRWAGLDPKAFELYTTYETSYHCKPNPDYYWEVADALGVRPEECLMVGNDADEDMVAQTVGMRVFLLTDCLINKSGRDLSGFPKGDLQDLLNYIEQI